MINVRLGHGYPRPDTKTLCHIPWVKAVTGPLRFKGVGKIDFVPSQQRVKVTK